MLFIYANPLKQSKTRIDYWAEAYAYPFFQQNWNLFVPPPSCNYNLYAEYEDKGLKKTELVQELLFQHQNNRLKGYGPFLLAFSNSIYYFEKCSKKQNKINGPIQDDINFTIVEYSAKKYLEQTRHIQLKKLKLILLVSDVLTKEQRIYFN